MLDLLVWLKLETLVKLQEFKMEIKIAESLKNTIDNSEKRVMVKPVGDGLPNTEEILWSFVCVDCPNTSIVHSGNAQENVFLSYGNTNPTMTMTISLPEEGVYKIKVVQNIITKNIRSGENHAISSNGELMTSDTEFTVYEDNIFLSKQFQLEYNNDDIVWT